MVAMAPSYAQTVNDFEDYVDASLKIGKWLSRSLGHYDFLSATPLSLKRAGEVFFIKEKKPAQYASDYGYSAARVEMSKEVSDAYVLFGRPAAAIPESFDVSRGHIGWGLSHTDDLTFSYTKVMNSDITGFGLGWKQVHWHKYFFFFSSNAKYSQIESPTLFSIKQLTVDLSASTYLFLVDLYVGFRHSSGQIEFKSTSDVLQMPDAEYVSPLNEIAHFYGITGRLTTNLRFTIETTKQPNETIVGAKLSFKFNSILPSFGRGWLRDPRYAK